jgi:precorrin-3B synthase
MSARAVFFSQRRGACPGLSAPMPTGDGLLVRFLPTVTTPLAAFVALCQAAARYGNGIIEVTARGSIQIRGLTPDSAPRFADAVAALGIAASEGVPVHTDPLAGLDPAEVLDGGVLAADLRRAFAHASLAQRLAPKVSVVVDGGGTVSLDGLAADVRLRAAHINCAPLLFVGVAGDAANASGLGAVATVDGVAAATRLLEVVAQRGRNTRARDILAAEGVRPFRAAIADLIVADVRHCGVGKHSDAIGTHRLRNGSLACGIGLPFGHADATPLQRLAERAETAGAHGLRTAPDRSLIVVGLGNETAQAFTGDAEQRSFIVRADDPRRHVIACAGAPICASGHIAARAIAPMIATTAAASADFAIHVSGCAKGCAHAGAAALTIVGTTAGCALIANGSARDVPFTTVPPGNLAAAIARHVSEARHV